jgi:aspartate--ammonia ligase
VLADVNALITSVYPVLDGEIERNVTFITAEKLLKTYPGLDAKAREQAIVREKKTVCVIGVGDPLSDGRPHDSRAPDYDDWALNCDILLWDGVLETALEISSMGVRVNAESLARQLKAANAEERASLPYHKAVLENRLPFTIGGGIGQSRICMLLLQKAHIGEVQVSVWPADMVKACETHGITLL